jgi:3',5'-cyclic AMP phosphodiesterase CpdA
MVRSSRAILSVVVALGLIAGWPGPHPEPVHAFQGSYETAAHDPTPSPIPDRIVLTWLTDPATSQAFTWRTDTTVTQARVEIAPAEASPRFMLEAASLAAKTERVESESGPAHFHSANARGLEPATRYAYRVGAGDAWSEWFHFRTASDEPEPFSFIYFGDAQNNVLSLWSRTLRSAYSDAPRAAFMVHAGDLINRANRDVEWGEWFEAGDWIQAMVPSIPTPGNHEYARDENGVRRLSSLWRPHFTLPAGDIEGLEETVYFVDYQGVRIVSVNSNERLEEQTGWLNRVLASNPNRWTVVVFHHPVFSTKEGRDNKDLRDLWKPLFDRHRVDLVLTGHDHSYGRGRNLPAGVTEVAGGTVYVVSVSGPKMYFLTDEVWWDRGAENTQLYQIISVDGDTLTYEARTAVGDLYDAFELVKRDGRPNRMIDRTPKGVPERRHAPGPDRAPGPG